MHFAGDCHLASWWNMKGPGWPPYLFYLYYFSNSFFRCRITIYLETGRSFLMNQFLSLSDSFRRRMTKIVEKFLFYCSMAPDDQPMGFADDLHLLRKNFYGLKSKSP